MTCEASVVCEWRRELQARIGHLLRVFGAVPTGSSPAVSDVAAVHDRTRQPHARAQWCVRHHLRRHLRHAQTTMRQQVAERADRIVDCRQLHTTQRCVCARDAWSRGCTRCARPHWQHRPQTHVQHQFASELQPLRAKREATPHGEPSSSSSAGGGERSALPLSPHDTQRFSPTPTRGPLHPQGELIQNAVRALTTIWFQFNPAKQPSGSRNNGLGFVYGRAPTRHCRKAADHPDNAQHTAAMQCTGIC
jgi:hypothetical protein